MANSSTVSSKSILVAPSLLACDFSRIADEMQKIEAAGADWVHVDVMDGHFVPNITIGPVIVEAIRKVSSIPLDVHLMIDHPEKYMKEFLDAGAHFVTAHIEAPGIQNKDTLIKMLEMVRSNKVGAGLSVKPKTNPQALEPFLQYLDLILVMSVEPGFGGQSFIPEVVSKIDFYRKSFQGHIAVDGGINAKTGQICREAGADVLVAGTYVFRAESYKEAIESLRES